MTTTLLHRHGVVSNSTTSLTFPLMRVSTRAYGDNGEESPQL